MEDGEKSDKKAKKQKRQTGGKSGKRQRSVDAKDKTRGVKRPKKNTDSPADSSKGEEAGKSPKKASKGRKKSEEAVSLTLSDFCGFCRGTRERNRYDDVEDLLTCSECGNSGMHFHCLLYV